MSLNWLWLEDEEPTIADFKSVVEQAVRVQTFRRIPDLTRHLLRQRQQLDSREATVGFVLDIMIQGAHAVMRPEGWFGGLPEAVFYANHGYEAGLVFYEKLILGDDGSSEPLIKPPPPVLFLTVMPQDAADFEVRLSAMRERWANAHGVAATEAKVQFSRKWGLDAATLVKTLRNMEVA